MRIPLGKKRQRAKHPSGLMKMPESNNTIYMFFFTLILMLCLEFHPLKAALACPTLPGIDINAGALIDVSAKTVLISYFEASKKGDAKTASSLIDYDEWAKDMNLQGDEKKQWIDMHKGTLQQDYDMEKKEGSTKEFKILSAETQDNEAVFKVSQERTSGKYIWEVRLIRKHEGQGIAGGRWRIKGFYPKQFGGAEGQVIQVGD